jgi:raffinose/stachyose/melibiose transport system substrate-binding protein
MLALTACSAGSLGTGGEATSGTGQVSLNLLIDNSQVNQGIGKALADAFNAKNPGIKVTITSRPGGGEGDNLVKTRLATGEMDDIFEYNSGSLFQALNPTAVLTPLTDQPWVGSLDETFKSAAGVGTDVYGAPFASANAGGILYNKKIYADLGLTVPTTWAEFMANNAKIKAAGKTAVIGTYSDTWTTQLLVLGDFRNVQMANPNWAADYTANKAKYVDEPALAGFTHLQEVYEAGYMNKNFASAKLDDGIKLLANGDGAHYPMLSGAIASVVAGYPDKVGDIGYFGIPGTDVATSGTTGWIPAAMYIPKSTTGAKLEAAKKFLAYATTAEACDVQSKAAAPTGPYVIKECTLPADVPPAVNDIQKYFTDGKVTPALEYLSPIKGPALEQITVEVGSGIRPAKDGAALYDKDVRKQAQQLGLPGW